MQNEVSVHARRRGGDEEAAGLDGGKMKFVVESRQGRNWSTDDTVTAEVRQGAAVGGVKAHRLAPGKKTPKAGGPPNLPAVLRLRTELA